MEKELNIILNREDENVVNIISNFQDNLDLLETEEITPIILDLLNCLIKKTRDRVIEEEISDKFLENIENNEIQEIIKKVDKEISNYIGNLFLEIINFINNLDAEEPKAFDYSLAIYGISESSNTKEVYQTYHYGDLKTHEKLLSCFAFYKDITDEILKNNSKEQSKILFKKVSDIMTYNIYNYIEKHK